MRCAVGSMAAMCVAGLLVQSTLLAAEGHGGASGDRTRMAAAQPHHDLVRVPLDPADAVGAALSEFNVVLVKPGVEAQVVVSPDEVATLRAAGLAPEILQADMETAGAYPDKGIGFGVYHTYSENVAFVDSLRLRFPNVVSEKWSLGTTYEGRDIWAFRVSANPDVDEDEPEVLIDGLHHGNEIMSAEFPLMFAEYLAQNYGTDPEVTWLLDHRELYLVPVVNPDGMVYNETTNPDGGGTWGKNRRNYSGTYGVNVNRNYPNHWGYDNVGSSPTPTSENYRGPSAASELETQAMLSFAAARQFVTHNSLHSFAGMVLYPWGYTTSQAPARAAFSRIATVMRRANGYAAGQMSAVLGRRNGVQSDSFYGDTASHPSIFSLTTEMGEGGDGFWPPADRRVPLFREHVWPNIYLMRIAGPFAAVHTPVATAPDGPVDPGDNGTLSFTVENQSVAATIAGVTVGVLTDDPWIQLQAAASSVGSLAAQAMTTTADNPLPFTVDAACPAGHQVRLTATVPQTGGALDFPLSFVVGSAPVLFSDDFENGLDDWTRSGLWDQTTSLSHSATHSLTDSPAGGTLFTSATYAQLNGTWRASRLRFWHRYDTEAVFDVAHVQVSADGGPWETVAAYSGSLTTWAQATIDLGAYAGRDLALRFLMTTDYSVTYDGWYIDDVVLEGDPLGTFAMATPAPAGPVVFTAERRPLLTVANAVVPGGGAAVYGFRVYRDAACTDLVASVHNVPETPECTSWLAPALPDGNYWWRAWGGDGTSRTLLSAAEPFTVTSATGIGERHDPALRVLGSVGGDGARLELTLPVRGVVTVDIHDTRGARVRRLTSGSLAEGTRTLTWDGCDDCGRRVASGVYLVRALVGKNTLTGRAVVVR